MRMPFCDESAKSPRWFNPETAHEYSTYSFVGLYRASGCGAGRRRADSQEGPFAGFGQTSLDKHHGQPPGSPLGGSMLDKHPSKILATPTPGAANTKAGTGIVLSNTWSAPLPESSGGHSLEIKDLGALLGPHGKPSDKLEAPAEKIIIYPGITYLMPQKDAEKVLGAGGITTKYRIACGGIPDGLSYTTYDGNWEGVFNRLLMVTDLADQVVSLEFLRESPKPLEHKPPWQRVTVTRHVLDYVNAMVKGQPGSPETWIYDTRNGLLIDTHSHQTARWCVPKPLINLILYCVEKSGVK